MTIRVVRRVGSLSGSTGTYMGREPARLPAAGEKCVLALRAGSRRDQTVLTNVEC